MIFSISAFYKFQPRLGWFFIFLRLLEGAATLLGVQPGAPRRALRLALAGENAGRFRDVEGDSYNVVVRLPLAERHPVSVLDQVYVPGGAGPVPLREIANPYLDAASNGLTYAAERLKELTMHGHVTLQTSERSDLAAAAAKYL